MWAQSLSTTAIPTREFLPLKKINQNMVPAERSTLEINPNQSQEVLQHSQNRPTGDGSIKL